AFGNGTATVGRQRMLAGELVAGLCRTRGAFGGLLHVHDERLVGRVGGRVAAGRLLGGQRVVAVDGVAPLGGRNGQLLRATHTAVQRLVVAGLLGADGRRLGGVHAELAGDLVAGIVAGRRALLVDGGVDRQRLVGLGGGLVRAR